MSCPEVDLILTKYCNELGSDDKRQRKRALESINKALLKEDLGNDYFIVSFEQVLKYIVSSFKDTSEAVRETAVVNMTELLKKLPVKELYISSLMPVISERLSGEITVESSEEVRLHLTLLIHELILTYTNYLHHYLDDFINIFVKTIVDPYPKVKIESCDCAADLAKAIPRYFHMQSESVISPLVQTLTHQQYRVRVAGVHSIGTVIRFGNNKSINDVCGPLAERLFDQHHAVRAAVANVVGMWLMELPDRYSYFHKLIPLMLTSLTEEIPELRKEAEDLWTKIGQQFMFENETDLKERMDYLEETLDHYPANTCRPNLGCRTLVQRELSKYMPAIVVELEDWKMDVRVKSAQLMCVTVQHAENLITQHLEKTLPALYRACGDSDARVSDNIELAAEMIGYFVPPDVYCRLMLPTVQDSSSAGPLRVLAAVVRTSLQTQIKPQLPALAELLASDVVCYSRQGEYQKQLLNAVESLQKVAKQDLSQVSEELFTTLVSVLGLAAEPSVTNHAKELIENLAKLNEITTQELYKQYSPGLLEKIGANVQEWSLHTPQRFIFEALLTSSGAAVGLSITKILSLLETSLKQENEPEAVLQDLIAVSYILTHNEETLCEVEDLTGFVEVLCTKALQQQLVWRAGRSAEALRTAAVGCVLTALQLLPCSRSLADSLLPQLLALVEDSAFKTRQFSTLSLLNLVKALRNSSALNAQDINTIFVVVLKRLDDNNDKVRETAVLTLCQLFTPPLPADYSTDCYRTSLEALYDTMLLHLDDPVPTFQNIMLDALKEVSKVHPKLLQSRIKIDNFRSKQKCEELISYLDNLHL